MRREWKRIKSKSCKSIKVNKISLSCFDDKRYIHDDGIKTL